MKNAKTDTATNSTPIFIIHGEDEFLISTKAQEIINKLLPPDQHLFGLVTIEGRAKNAAEATSIIKQCIENIGTTGFASRKIVWLRGVSFLGKDVTSQSKAVQGSISVLTSGIAGGLPSGHTLIITTLSLNAQSDFSKTCGKAGEIIFIETEKKFWKRDEDITRQTLAAFSKYGLRARNDALKAFVERVGSDTRQIDQETKKLAVFIGDRKDVQTSDVEAITSVSKESSVWILQDAVAERKASEALSIAHDLMFRNEDPIGLLMCLDSRFRYLIVLREALDKKWISLSTNRGNYSTLIKDNIPENMEKAMTAALSTTRGKMTPGAESRLAAQANRFTFSELTKCREMIMETRIAMIYSNISSQIQLKLLIAKLCRKSR